VGKVSGDAGTGNTSRSVPKGMIAEAVLDDLYVSPRFSAYSGKHDHKFQSNVICLLLMITSASPPFAEGRSRPTAASHPLTGSPQSGHSNSTGTSAKLPVWRTWPWFVARSPGGRDWAGRVGGDGAAPGLLGGGKLVCCRYASSTALAFPLFSRRIGTGGPGVDHARVRCFGRGDSADARCDRIGAVGAAASGRATLRRQRDDMHRVATGSCTGAADG